MNPEMTKIEREPIPYQEAMRDIGFIMGFIASHQHREPGIYPSAFIDALINISRFVEENHPPIYTTVHTILNPDMDELIRTIEDTK